MCVADSPTDMLGTPNDSVMKTLLPNAPSLVVDLIVLPGKSPLNVMHDHRNVVFPGRLDNGVKMIQHDYKRVEGIVIDELVIGERVNQKPRGLFVLENGVSIVCYRCHVVAESRLNNAPCSVISLYPPSFSLNYRP